MTGDVADKREARENARAAELRGHDTSVATVEAKGGSAPAGLDSSSSLLPPRLRWLAPPASACFYAAILCRNAAYGLGIRRTVRAAVPVISVGNLTVGGTGKTPCTIMLARELLALGRRPAVLTRGYGAEKKGKPNDEALLMRRLLPDVPVLVGAERSVSAQRAVEQDCNVLLLDDGFQHRRLRRDLDIVLLDAAAPFGGGRLLPWGRLREKPAALARADVVLVTRADAVSRSELKRLRGRVSELAPRALFASARHRPTTLRRLRAGAEEQSAVAEESPREAADLRGMKVFAACGLAQPEAFFTCLKASAAELAGRRVFPDHHRYTRGDLEELRRTAEAAGAEAVLVTEKDAVKIERAAAPDFLNAAGSPAFWALGVEFEITTGDKQLRRKLEATLKEAEACGKEKDPRKLLGEMGEEYAWKFLKKRKQRLVEKNFRCPVGEIDLITRDGETLVFCEVRTRREGAAVSALESVGPRKRRHILRTAQWWLQRRQKAPSGTGKTQNKEPQIRFDVVALTERDGKITDIEYIQDAFSA